MEDDTAALGADSDDAKNNEFGMGAVAGGEAPNDNDHSSSNSSAGNETDEDDSSFESYEEEDAVEEFVRRLRANDKATDEIHLMDLAEEKWDFFEKEHEDKSYREAEAAITEAVNEDIVKIFGALADNSVVTKINLNFLLPTMECRIAMAGASAIARALSENQSVVELVVAGQVIRGEDEIITILQGLESTSTQIKKLSITGHFEDSIMEGMAPAAVLKSKACHFLATLLSENTSIEELELTWNSAAWRQCCDIICRGLGKNVSIKKLNLLHNDYLPPRVSSRLCESVSGRAEVKVSSNATSDLQLLVRNNKNIEELQICFIRRLGSKYWTELIGAFKEGHSIKCMSFSNEVKEEGMYDVRLASLVEAISTSSVEKLTFNDMLMGDEGIGAICEALAKSNSLRGLEFINCSNVDKQITQLGAESLATLLRECKTFESVKLHVRRSGYKYYVGNQGAITIANAVVMRKRAMKEIFLKKCGIRDEGAMALCRLLDIENVRIEVLGLCSNAFGLSICENFAACLSSNKHLRVLDLAGPRGGNDGASQTNIHILFFKSLEKNRTLEYLALPIETSQFTSKQKAKQWRALYDLLNVNHTVKEISCVGGDELRFLKRKMEKANKKHPILASTMKRAPFPAYLLQNLSGGVYADALARADTVAGIDGVFGLFRQISVGISGVSDYDQKKRGREE